VNQGCGADRRRTDDGRVQQASERRCGRGDHLPPDL